MQSENILSEVGTLAVKTTDHRGHSVNEIADRAVDHIVSISDDAPEPIKVQAYAFKERCRKVIEYYMQEAVNNHMCTIGNKLEQQGHKDLANIIRRL